MSELTRKSVSAVKHALLASRLREESADLRLMQSEPIAVIGMACRAPGPANTPEALWELLAAGADAIAEIPEERWSRDAWYDPDPAAAGKINTRFGGFLAGVDGFDPAAFGISPKEARYMDPQQRLLLETAWEAFDDGGAPLETMRGSRTGVFFGVSNSDYGRMQLARPDAISAYTLSGTAPSIAAGRLSYLFDLRGPSLVVDTACSSSLVAVHLAVQNLRNGECDAAVAGGVSLNLKPEETISLAKWGMLAPDGRCKTFDAGANGFVRSEGCGVVVLMRLADAVRGGYRIQAVIRGSAVNQDGRSNVLTAPNGEAQRAVIRDALRQSGVAPGDVTFVETHGTGTKVGDPIEVEALLDVYATGRSPDNPCHLGAIKANLGHLEAAAGIAGLIKVVLCLRHKAIPPQVHFKSLNPLLSLADTSLRIPASLLPWETGGRTRVAGLSSFGFSGTNAHLVIEEPPLLPLAREASDATPHLLPLSARHAAGVGELAAGFAKLLSGQRLDELADLCFTAARRRTHLAYRQALVGDAQALREQLAAASALPLPRPGVEEPKLCFAYSGQGCNWFGMARGLLHERGVFNGVIDACDEILRPLAGWSIRDQLEAPADACRLHRTDYFQPVLFAIQAGLTAQLAHWGIRPFAVTGHSVGEIAAAHAAGILSLEDALTLVQVRGRLMQEASGRGAMAAVALSAEAMRQRLGNTKALTIAAANAPEASTVSGEAAALSELLARLQKEGIFCRQLDVECAFHSAQMDACAALLEKALAGTTHRPGQTIFVSSVTGTQAGDARTRLDAAYWGRNVREPVLFHPAIVEMLRQGCTAFVEIGPHPVLSGYILETAAATNASAPVLPTMRRDRDDRVVLREAVAGLYAHGCDPDWTTLAPRGRIVSLPPCPWQRESYWLPEERPAARAQSLPRGDRVHPLLGWRVDSPFAGDDVFENIVAPIDPPYLTDHRIGGTCLVPATAMIDTMLRAVQESTRAGTRLENFAIDEPLVMPDDGEVRIQTGIVEDTAGTTVRIYSRHPQSSGRWLLHASSRMSGSQSAAALQPRAIEPLHEIRQACTQAVAADAYYREGRSAGLDFGPAFRSLADVTLGEDRACGRVTLHESARANATHYVLHPVLLDGALQLIDVACRKSAQGDRLLLPIGVDAVHVYAPLHEEAFAVATLHGSTGTASVVRADVDLFTTSGELRASLSGVQLKATHVQALSKLLDTASRAALPAGDRWSYRLGWNEEAAAPADANAPRRDLLIATSSLEAARALATEAKTAHNYGDARILLDTADGHDGGARHEAVDFTEGAGVRDALEKAVAALSGTSSVDVVLCAGLAGGDAEPPAAGRAADLAAQHRATAGALHVMQALAATAANARVFLVTRGAQAPLHENDDCDPAQAALWGLGSTVQVEHPELDCTMIDLDPDASWRSQLPALLDEMCHARRSDRVALRETRRFVCRLEAAPDIPSAMDEPGHRIQLQAPGNGLLDKLVFAEVVRGKPAAGEVEIETRALGLNFRDVLNALGEVEGPAGAALGAECAGVVVAVGEGVRDFSPGDAVMAFALGGMSSHVIVPAALVARIPASLDMAEAASCPVAFLTAKYALERVASLQKGETVLIHAAAGGVGLAAVQVATRRGARVIATAGSPEKRSYLHRLGVTDVLDSRDPAFADGVRRATGDGGVDVVLNSLAGEFIPASLALLKQERGRFVELGKRDDWNPERVRAAYPGIVHTRFDLGMVATENPQLIRALFAELTADLESGDLQPLPYRPYPLQRAAQACRRMAHGRHLGKLVLSRAPAHRKVPLARADASYLVTGGLGALGLSVAERLAALGARHLILTGRSAGSDSARARVRQLRDAGVDVRAWQVDVADFDALDKAFGEIGASLPPLKGVVHCAGVLADAALTRQTWRGFLAVMQPKVAGAWNLHELTRRRDLDYFVLFSSVAPVIGWPGQANYAAANAVMDGIARYRRARGLPAQSINWGAWGTAGMVQNVRDELGDPFSQHGLIPHEPEEGIDAFVRIVENTEPERVVGHFDWTRFQRRYPSGRVPDVFSRVGGKPAEAAFESQHAPQHRLVDELKATPPAQRRRVLDQFLVGQAVAALGLSASTSVKRKVALNEQGLDSLLAVEMRNAIAQALGCILPASLLFDYPSIDALGRHLQDDVLPRIGIGERDEPTRGKVAPIGRGKTPLDADIEHLSDEEAELLLSQELGVLAADRKTREAAD